MRALVVGASGLVGGALLRILGQSATGTYRSRAVPGLRELDVRDAQALRAVVCEIEPSVVYYPAADPNVDWCEQHPDAARELNVTPVFDMITTCRDVGANLVFFSTDYVFDGKDGPYAESSAVAPLSVYGQHKLEVERGVLDAGGTVVRTTTVFGLELPPGKNFVIRLVARLRAGEEATIPADQFATPTWSDDLARGAVAVGNDPGLWHVAGPDFMPRDDFARVISDVFGCDASLIRPVSTEALKQAARRPMRGGLRTEKIREAKQIEFTPAREALARLRVVLEPPFA